jgi:hypothetical protein
MCFKTTQAGEKGVFSFGLRVGFNVRTHRTQEDGITISNKSICKFKTFTE